MHKFTSLILIINLFFISSVNAESFLRIHEPIKQDFIDSFYTRTSQDPTAWVAEMEKHYSYPGFLTYRGYCYKNENNVGINDLKRAFVTVNYHMMSKAIDFDFKQALFSNTPFALKDKIDKQFERFNTHATNKTLIEAANIHQKGTSHQKSDTELYYKSLGYSTSKSLGAAARFTYNWDNFEKTGNGSCTHGIVFGAFVADKDIDFASLEIASMYQPEYFRMLYPQELEVLGIGAGDPDALMAAFKVSFQEQDYGRHVVIDEMVIRNPKKPHELLHIQGALDTIAQATKRYNSEEAEFIQKVSTDTDKDNDTYPYIPGPTFFKIEPGKTLPLIVGGKEIQPKAIYDLKQEGFYKVPLIRK